MSTFQKSAARRTSIAGAGAQAIDGNAMNDRGIEMIELAEHKSWPHGKRRANVPTIVRPGIALAVWGANERSESASISRLNRQIGHRRGIVECCL